MEWKPALLKTRRKTLLALETFLGGMETYGRLRNAHRCRALETFLGGMETSRLCPSPCRLRRALKPSLVEWKRESGGEWSNRAHGLETFLGGMETYQVPIVRDIGDILETFLGGMETRLVRKRRLRKRGTLKPSLVEWKQRAVPKLWAVALEPLKPSLVEWKRFGMLAAGILFDALETFLGGMETSHTRQRA